MKLIRMIALLVMFGVTFGAFAQTKKTRTTPRKPLPRQTPQRPTAPEAARAMNSQEEFYYFIAIYGFGKRQKYFGSNPEFWNDIEYYGLNFDRANYDRAMADEFERNRYAKQTYAKILDEIGRLDFNRKFAFATDSKVGDYDFQKGAFPIALEFADSAVNGIDFRNYLPLSESEASAFVKRNYFPGNQSVDRRVICRTRSFIASRALGATRRLISRPLATQKL